MLQNRRKNKFKGSYALLNQNGFSSVRSTRTRTIPKKVNNGSKTNSFPTSPVLKNKVKKNTTKSSEEEFRTEINSQQLTKAVNALLADIHTEATIGDNADKHDNHDKYDKCDNHDKHNTSDTHTVVSNNHDIVDITIADRDNEMATALELQKKAIKDDIARMECELREQQEDQELRDLRKKQEQLRQKLSKSSSAREGEESVEREREKTSKRRTVNKKKVKEGFDDKKQGDNKSVDALTKDFDEVVKEGLPSLSQIQDMLFDVAEKTSKHKKPRKTKKRRSHRKRQESSLESTPESSTSSETSTALESESSDEEEKSYKHKRGKKLKSGIFDKVGHSHIISNEAYAHAALDDEVGTDKELRFLSFNLLVAGELEINTNPSVRSKERETRLELLKKLAYKKEHLNQEEIINQYISFVRKVEKGKFKWGSKSTMRQFEQQLIYCISIENKRGEAKSKQLKNKMDDRVKYCLDFNRGKCSFDKVHEGKINGEWVMKQHVCRKCLINQRVEVNHAEKDCTK